MKSINNVNNNSAVMKKTIKRPGISIRIKEPGSAITHFIAAILTLVGTSPLMMRAHQNNADNMSAIALIVFCTSMFLLYMSSTILHTFDISPSVNEMLQKLDHAMIYVLIAGTYTPILLKYLAGLEGWIFTIAMWACAIIGIVIKLCWFSAPRWLQTVLYIAMGWAILFDISIFQSMSGMAVLLLALGGISYTAGGVIYILKKPNISAQFGFHELFHMFVLAGSLFHFFMIFFYVA